MHLYTDLLLTLSTYLCKDYYNCALELIRSTNNKFTTDNEVTDNVVDKDKDFFYQVFLYVIYGKILYVKNQLKIM